MTAIALTYRLEHGLIARSNLFWFKLAIEDCTLEVFCISLYGRLAWFICAIEILSDFIEVSVSFAFFTLS